MLALAKREVVTERVESLLKIGLGPLGMVRHLNPFRCVEFCLRMATLAHCMIRVWSDSAGRHLQS